MIHIVDHLWKMKNSICSIEERERERKILKMEEKMQTSMIHITSGKLKIREKERVDTVEIEARVLFYRRVGRESGITGRFRPVTLGHTA